MMRARNEKERKNFPLAATTECVHTGKEKESLFFQVEMAADSVDACERNKAL